MTASMLLVHSPLVGPSSWSSLAPLVRARGIDVAVPDLTGVSTASRPAWRQYVADAAAAATELPGTVVVTGHSGAGVMLPAIAAELGDRHDTTVFVDAVVPPLAGAHRTSPSRRNAYIQTSPAYDDHRRRSTDLGWPTARLDGTHLSILTDPQLVLAAIDDLTGELAERG